MASQAVVGVLRAILSADTAQFDTSMKRSAQQVTAFGEQTTRAAAGIAKSLSGQKLISEANHTAEAIRLIGGAAKLTASEAARLEPAFSKAIEKMKVMGVDVPPAMLKMRDSLKHVADQGEKTGGIFQSLGAKMVAAFSVGMLVDRGVMALVNFGREALASASNIKDLSVKLGVSTDAVQEWTFAARQSGASMDDVSRAVVQMNDRLATGNASTVSALKLAGLEFAAIRAMKPEEAFNAIAQAIADIEDPMTQTRVAMDLFGKGGAEMLAAIKAGMIDQMALAPKMSAATVEGLDQAQDEWQRFFDNLTVWTGEAISKLRQLHFYADIGNRLIDTFGLVTNGGDTGDIPKTGRAKLGARTGGALPIFDLKDAIDAGNEATQAVEKILQRVTTARIAAANAIKAAELKALAETIKFHAAIDRAANEGMVALRDRTVPLVATILKLGESLREVSDAGKGVLALNLGRIGGLIPGMGDKGVVLGPPPTSTAANDERVRDRERNERTRQYVDLLGLASQAAGEAGANMKGFGRLAIQALQGGISMIQTFITMERARATASSIAWAAATFGISLAITAAVMYHEKMKATNETLRALREEIRAFGLTPIALYNVDLLQKQLAAIKKSSEAITKAMEGMTASARHFGGVAPPALQAFIKELLLSNKLTAEQRKLLEGLAGDPAWKEWEDRAIALGVPIDALGKSFQQLKSNALAADLHSFFKMFEDGDQDAILTGIADELQAIIDQSIKFGTVLPNYLKPMIMQAQKLGLITGDFGKNLENLNFGEIKSPFDDMVSLLEQIRDILAKGFPNAELGAKGGIGSPKLPGGNGAGDMPTPRMPKQLPDDYGGVAGFNMPVGVSSGAMTVQLVMDGRQTAAVIVPWLPGETKRYAVGR